MKETTKEDEQVRVDLVEDLIDSQLDDTNAKLHHAQAQTHQIEISYGSNTRVNTFEVDDQMETNASVQQQKQLISMSLENETVLTNKQQQLENLKGSPYFGRIDILDNDTLTPFYIGTGTLQDDNNNFLVHDWRAPISGLYYNGTLGPVKLELPDKNKEVQLKLKRQFKIEDGKIRNMFDTNETVGDEILQNALGEKSSDYMKNIVATIQNEQNIIIRDTKADVLIVQGAAGSGKTSTILQRIAYQLYHSRNQLNNDNMILFSPNKLFSGYISHVLPSLGEKNMRQVTLDDFLSRRLFGIKVETLFDRFERDLASLPDETKKIRLYKESSEFFDIVKKQFSKADLPLEFEDILFEGEIFFGKEHIAEIYQSFNKNIPTPQKFLGAKNFLIKELKRRIKLDASQEWVQDELDNLDDLAFQQLLKDNKIENSERQREYLSQKFLKERYRPIYNSLYNDFFFNPYRAYVKFLKSINPKGLNPIAWNSMIKNVDSNIEYHKIRLSDAVLVLLIRDLVTGTGTNYSIQSLFVDEMQDYPLSVFKYLNFIFPKSKFTLLGDFSQDLFATTYNQNDRLSELQTIFNKSKLKTITLNQSYRSSAPITNFAKAILPNGDDIKTFSRNGNKPILKSYDYQDDYLKDIEKTYSNYKDSSNTIAILTKTKKEAQALYNQLKQLDDVYLITENTRSLKNGLLILPIYLAKGLEFDTVIANDISKNNYPDATETDTIYTIFTRAMHQLIVTTTTEFSPILNKIDEKLYDLK